MNTKRIILGSGSPRRKEILEQVGISFEVIAGNKDEIITKKKPKDIVCELSLQKAGDVKGILQNERKDTEDLLIICADTMVAKGRKILGKPKSKEQAVEMLSMLQNGSHQVYTGVTLLSVVDGKEQLDTFYSVTKVYMDAMSNAEIWSYIETGECMDKAGSYAIQGYGAKYIKKIVGDYYNVMGLPVEKVYHRVPKKFFS